VAQSTGPLRAAQGCERSELPKDNPAYPFCSERCRLVDLGRWLGEEYRVPADDATASASTSPSPEPEK